MMPTDFRYGDNIGAYKSHLYGSPSIIACSPSLCKFVLNSSDKFIQEWPTNEVLGTNTVSTMHGDRHAIVKYFIQHFFSRPNALARIVPQIQPTIVAALQSWSKLPQIKTFYHIKKVTLDYTMKYIAGLEVGTQINDFEKLFEGIINGFRAQPWNIPGTTYSHAVKCRMTIMKMLREEMKKRKRNKIKNNVEEGYMENDLMEGLMKMKDKEEKQLSDEEVLDNVIHTTSVGHISIAYAVTWSIYFLAKSPHVLHKLREENKALLKEKNNDSITYEDVLKLKYTIKVVEETLRMANLSGFVFRRATDDIEFKGYMIPKDWSVIVWLRQLHNDPTNFEDPMCFNPDRWDTRPKYGTYLPFGGGSRSCPGTVLVRVSVVLFLHHLSIGYKWNLLNPEGKIKYLSHPLPVDGLEISIKEDKYHLD
ncbi:ent-kaurenoic acid oxidase 1-like isoform X2 [Amaranthus tricolor]|uniref:ent-kaurenoic acid oxidase 1-like isoform X2 n=1 Tax=Amaranthus tricolor TaxID=29722 RepID=UPI00258A1941|nr:ent-kaurenoic acid oxidase 1-like isoform X2 [Amaranthus tricolor]